MTRFRSLRFGRVVIVCLAIAGLAWSLPGDGVPVRAGEKSSAGDWPQFRGPTGQGVVTGKIPTSWSDTENKAWDVKIPGKGWSSPIVVGETIWLTTAVAKEGGGFTLRVLGLDRASGKTVHDITPFTIEKANPLHARNSLATPTPIADNGRLYVSFGTNGVAAIDTATGSVLWKNDTLKLDYETGAASSPVIYKDKLILPCDAADDQFVIALDTATGAQVWKTERPQALKKGKSSRRAFATPLLFQHDGKTQIVIPGSHCIYSYDPETGKELWRVQTNGFSNVPRPLYAHGLIFTTTGFAPPEMIAIRPDGEGDVTKTHVAWRQRKNVPNVPSAVLVDGLLFMISDQGTATCLDAKTGDVQWTERLQGPFSASLLVKDKTIYAFSDEGKTTMFEAAAKYKELGKNEINAGKINATPAAAGNALYLRTDSRLMKLGQ